MIDSKELLLVLAKEHHNSLSPFQEYPVYHRRDSPRRTKKKLPKANCSVAVRQLFFKVTKKVPM